LAVMMAGTTAVSMVDLMVDKKVEKLVVLMVA
jgi:hypothetical protein